jgi:hypothetical protein
MKKLIIALVFCLMAVPAMAADVWEVTFNNLSPDADHAIFYYGERDPDLQTADEFLARTDLTATPPVPLTEMASISIDYPADTKYSLFGKVFNAAGDADFLMDDMGDYVSPTVWNKTASKPMGPAHDVNVDGGGSVSVDVNVSVKTTYTVE